MTYESFKHSILERLNQDIPDPKKITIQKITKNNNLCLDGLSILEKDQNMSPTLYLNYYYREYETGAPFQDVYEKLLDTYELYKPHEKVNASFFEDYSNVKEHLIYKLVNFEKNAQMLQKVPHMRYLDLAIVFQYMLISDENHYATILIQNNHLDLWDITQETLFKDACDNTPILLPVSITCMSDYLDEMNPEYLEMAEPEAQDEAGLIYILSNHFHMNGAGCILYPGLLQKFANEFHTNFVLIPSSIHEFLLIPWETSRPPLNRFSEIIREVNRYQVEPQERLADHAYYYDRVDNRISY